MNRQTCCVIGFSLIFVASVVLVIVANICADGFKQYPEVKEIAFWQTSVIYQVYPRSLLDSNEAISTDEFTIDDGIGDLAGIREKLPYFLELGIGVVWLSPIFESPMADFGYDISNFTNIDPIFGTLQEFDDLVTEAHSLGLKVVMDLVPNHSSDEHEWFIKSVDKEDPYTDYYVWSDPVGTNETGAPIPPNNWLSVFKGSAWKWNEKRQQFYFHQFLDKQPDLNFRNPLVLEEMNNVIRFWMDRGLDGMRLDAIKHMYEVEDIYQDEPLSGNPDVTDPNQYEYLNHTLTTNQPETLEAIGQWRQILDTYSGSRLIMAETYYETMDEVMAYYGTEEEPLADFPFNFNFILDFSNRSDVTGLAIKTSIDKWLDNLPEGKWPNWVLGNHDRGRISSRLGADLVDSLNMISLLLPGTAITYYGEEIGMSDTFISYEDTQDPYGCNYGPERYTEFSRDPARTPMQWDNTSFAGFTNGNDTWLPVNENYVSLNVEAQKAANQSSFKVYQSLAQLRKEEVFFSGQLAYPVVTETIFSFVRYITGTTYLLVVNTSEESVEVDLHHNANFQLPETGEVMIRSSFDDRNVTEPGTSLDLSAVPLMAGEGLALLTSTAAHH